MKAGRPVRILAWALVVGSFPMWAVAVAAAPFFPLPAAQRVVAATVIAAAGEAMFWTGGAILGVAVVARFRRPRVTTGRSRAGRGAAVTGRRTRLLAGVDKLSPLLAGRLGLRRAGHVLRDAFSSKATTPRD